MGTDPIASAPATTVRHRRAALADDRAADAVSALYRANAHGMIRLAFVLLGDQNAAEDIVQAAFCGMYRRWQHLSDQDKAVPYLRSAVLNACRSALRRKRFEVSAEPTGS